MEAMRQSWTDERLDDFRGETQRRFDEVDRRLDKVDTDIRDLRGTMDSRFARIDARLDALNQTILRLGGGALVTFVLGFVGLIAT
jgi:flagellar capping protein FliD